ncbi:transketolase, partial [Streptococcus suis]
TEATRKALDWNYGPIEIPAQVYADVKANVADRGAAAYDDWVKLVEDYKVAHPQLEDQVTANLEVRDVVEINPEDYTLYEN